MENTPKLIIIRGPSASGKSAIAKAIKKRSDRPTVWIEQDLFRTLSNEKVPTKLPVFEMIEANTLLTLKHGFDVILEGILNVKKPGRLEMYDRIFQAHPDENYIYYLNTSFEETVVRHKTRADKREQFGAEAMKEWYDLASPTGHEKEVVIPESSTQEETIQTIAKISGLSLKTE